MGKEEEANRANSEVPEDELNELDTHTTEESTLTPLQNLLSRAKLVFKVIVIKFGLYWMDIILDMLNGQNLLRGQGDQVFLSQSCFDMDNRFAMGIVIVSIVWLPGVIHTIGLIIAQKVRDCLCPTNLFGLLLLAVLWPFYIGFL